MNNKYLSHHKEIVFNIMAYQHRNLRKKATSSCTNKCGPSLQVDSILRNHCIPIESQIILNLMNHQHYTE